MIISGLSLGTISSIDQPDLKIKNRNDYQTPMVLMFGNSVEEVEAKDELTKNFGSIFVVNFDMSTIKYVLESNNPIIWIGHGLETGMENNGDIIAWETIGDLIDRSQSQNHVIVACNSIEVTNYIDTEKDVVGFSGEIDALYGANIASLIIGMIYKFHKSLTNTFFAKAQERAQLGPSDPTFSKLGFSDSESIARFAIGGTALVGLVLSATAVALSQIMSVAAAGIFLAMASFYEVLYVAQIMMETGTTDAVQLGNFISLVLSFASALVSKLSWSLALTLSAAIATDTAVAIVVSAALVISVIAGIINLYIERNKWIHDLNDCNGDPAEVDGMEIDCAPQKPSGPTSVTKGQSNTWYFEASYKTVNSFDLLVNWGDGTENLLYDVGNGEPASISHTYYSTGTKSIKVRATADGAWTGWSATLSIYVSSSNSGGINPPRNII